MSSMKLGILFSTIMQAWVLDLNLKASIEQVSGEV
jgi:hypothetical protein